MGMSLRLTALLLRASYALVISAFHGSVYLIATAWRSVRLLRALHQVRGQLALDTLRCPRGHDLETTGTYQCEQCSYVYEGSAWLCANPECQATTPYINCACGLSVRNPYRVDP